MCLFFGLVAKDLCADQFGTQCTGAGTEWKGVCILYVHLSAHVSMTAFLLSKGRRPPQDYTVPPGLYNRGIYLPFSAIRAFCPLGFCSEAVKIQEEPDSSPPIRAAQRRRWSWSRSFELCNQQLDPFLTLFSYYCTKTEFGDLGEWTTSSSSLHVPDLSYIEDSLVQDKYK